jgi:hypothetical protein
MPKVERVFSKKSWRRHYGFPFKLSLAVVGNLHPDCQKSNGFQASMPKTVFVKKTNE